MLRTLLTLLFVVSVGASFACDGEASECESFAAGFCEEACDCSGECRIVFPSGSTQSFGNEIASPREQCLTALAGSCEMGDLDIPSCDEIVSAPVCEPTASGDALALTEACYDG